ncbi:MAG: DNA mismatch repair endonuclease MutL [Fimbriimonas sp.]
MFDAEVRLQGGGEVAVGARAPVGVKSTGRVHLLDPHTVNQIAAGEVVERPASVVKELVENALDAGATRIELDLEASGRALIRIADDGCGMNPEDALRCLQRHATSKIRAVEDLERVGSLGFRGEAIPSIASVSHFTLLTAEADGLRTRLDIDGGQASEATFESGPKGTEIRVADLFFNTPARLKFLKSDNTELGQCLEIVSRYAIAYPHVAFRMTHNGQLALSTTGSGDLHEALAGVWGRDLTRALAPVDLEAAGMRVRGFVSPPHVTKPTRSMQYVVVNGRPVRTRTLTAAIDQAYRDLTPDRRFPILALQIDVDPARVDVNVSPTKSEVKFQHEGQVFDALRIAVRQSLMEHGMMPSAAGLALANEALAASAGGSSLASVGFGTPGAGPARLANEMFGIWGAGGESGAGHPALSDLSLVAQRPLEAMQVPLPASGLVGEFGTAGGHAELPQLPSSSRYPFADLLDGLRVIGQAMNTFILAETSRGLAIIDQHVAHERILYEYLCGLKGESAIERQPLLVPETLHLDRRSTILLQDKLEELSRIGFDLEPFGGESYVVRTVPAAIRGRSATKVLRDLIDDLVEATVVRRLTPTREQIWITSSCKMAVKAGDPLSHAEMEKLIVDLASTENPYLCPHGRPITLILSDHDLLRAFKRT